MPSPISMHIPKIETKSNTLWATILFLKKLTSLLFLSVFSGKTEFELARLEERIPIFIFLQSNEYTANVPPAVNKLYGISCLLQPEFTNWSILKNKHN